MSNIPEIVDKVISLDGSKRWQLFQREDGLYSAAEDTLHSEASGAGEDRIKFDSDNGHNWTPRRVSGPFDTVEAAQHDALDNLPWFFEAISRDAGGS